MSLPILTSLAKATKMPDTFMGVQKATVNIGTAEAMHNGLRLLNSPEGDRLTKLWQDAGHLDSFVSEANSVMRASRRFEKDSIAKVENALDNKLVDFLSFPADKAESMVRSWTMHTGAALAKNMYPELNDAGVTIFARDFMDRAVGNYHASQRPVFFQGTAGVALGLFQTYMLTLGQNIYRHLEFKDYKAIGKAALLQGGIFGAKSLPGFDAVSEAIGNHYSDDNVDLTTGTYRAVSDPIANATLYGLPSSLGASFTSRGGVSPRAPNPLGSPANLAAVNIVSQSLAFLQNFATAAGQSNEDSGRAMLQAISLQSVSRPLARGAELASGYSVTQKGNTIQTPADVYSFTGVAARLLATRPTEEAKLREMNHLATVYGTLDRDNRNAITTKLKTALRNGTLDDAKSSEYAAEYMRYGGTPTGWRSNLATATAQSNTNGKEALLKHLKPDNPLNYMIDSLDGD
jgi:hypothetical protein